MFNNNKDRMDKERKIALVIKTEGLEYDDRVRKEILTVEIYNKRAVVSRLLTTYTNINEPRFHPCWKRMKLHLWHFKDAMFALLKLHFAEFNTIITGYCLYFRAIPKVNTSRKKNMLIGSNWLKIQ